MRRRAGTEPSAARTGLSSEELAMRGFHSRTPVPQRRRATLTRPQQTANARRLRAARCYLSCRTGGRHLRLIPLTRALEALATLDVAVANHLASDPDQLAAWKRSRALPRTKRRGEAADAEAEPVPAARPGRSRSVRCSAFHALENTTRARSACSSCSRRITLYAVSSMSTPVTSS